MPLSRRNRTKKIRRSDNLELDSILKFIKFIQCISCGMLGISLIGILTIKENVGGQVVYTMTIIVNLIIILGGIIPIKYLTKKNESNYNAKKV
ncbi:hypothetical protein [Clostridium sp. C2-6-12]|uniref:hypothetical protein n=1 Tax=Clostridium sp. C2-6-12 TaxID=2698832 RepID=UPI00136CB19D|nr:hypothetical protein [Clostridium sp. C2-6-12]